MTARSCVHAHPERATIEFELARCHRVRDVADKWGIPRRTLADYRQRHMTQEQVARLRGLAPEQIADFPAAQAAEFTNPWTQQPLDWDPRRREIGFVPGSNHHQRARLGAAALLAGGLRASLGVIPGVRLLDRIAGLALGLVAGVFLCWAVGAVLLYVPGETELRRSVQRSTILSEINDVFPPERLLEELERVDPIGVFLGPPAIVAPPEKGIARDPDVARASKSVVRITGMSKCPAV